MQTTTAVSADVPAQTQHITNGRSLWVEEATRLHDADNHYCFRGHVSKNAEVYGSGKRRGCTMQMTTAVSADVPAQTQHITKGKSLWIEESAQLHDADDHYRFRGHASKNAEVYGSGRRGSTMQMTTAVSADVPAQTQHITKGKSLWIEESTRLHDADDHYRFRGHASKNAEVYGSGRRGSTMQMTTAVSADVPAQTQHITKGRSLWIEEATRLHDADDHYRFRRHASKNAEDYGSGRRGSTMQTTTAVSADVPAQTQHITKGKSLWIEEATRLHDADDHYRFRERASKNAEVYGLGKRRGSTMQLCREAAPFPCRA